eukprot:1134742-Pelagomonas_calceolata.AAC.2
MHACLGAALDVCHQCKGEAAKNNSHARTYTQEFRCSSIASSDGRSSTSAALVSSASTPLPAQPLQPSLFSARTAAHKVSAGRSSVSSSLVGVLKDELKYARESYRRYELVRCCDDLFRHANGAVAEPEALLKFD